MKSNKKIISHDNLIYGEVVFKAAEISWVLPEMGGGGVKK